MRQLQNRGDTIVEVLIAIVVIGAVLTGAYVTGNQSLNANRAAQERAEALKYVEGQVERIKANVAVLGAPSPPGPGAGPYCLDKTTGAVDTITPPAGDPNINNDNFSYPSGCNQGLISGSYHLSITQTGGLYTIRARWDRIGGGSRQEIKTLYRIQP